MIKAWAAQILSMLIGLGLYYFAMESSLAQLGKYVSWTFFPFAGGLLAALALKERRFRLGASTAIPAVLMIWLVSYMAGCYWKADCYGLAGHLVGTAMIAPIVVAAAVAGSWLGEMLGNKRTSA